MSIVKILLRLIFCKKNMHVISFFYVGNFVHDNFLFLNKSYFFLVSKV